MAARKTAKKSDRKPAKSTRPGKAVKRAKPKAVKGTKRTGAKKTPKAKAPTMPRNKRAPATPSAPRGLTRIPIQPSGADAPETPVVVARSLIAQGRIQVTLQAPPRLDIPLGGLLLVRHAYELQEASNDRETYTFTLQASMEGHEKERIVERIKDRIGVEDDMAGFIQHRFRPRLPGTYNLEFDVEAEYEVSPWRSSKVLQKEKRAAAGRLTVVVA